MVETLGFILGEYTLPSHLPAIYIADSNNARTLQRNIKNIEDFMHQKKIRKIKQGIDYSIANQLEYLTKKWPQRDHQNFHTRSLYERGEEICKLWVLHKNSTKKDCSVVQSTTSQNLSYNEESSEESSMDHSIDPTSVQGQNEKNICNALTVPWLIHWNGS